MAQVSGCTSSGIFYFSWLKKRKTTGLTRSFQVVNQPKGKMSASALALGAAALLLSLGLSGCGADKHAVLVCKRGHGFVGGQSNHGRIRRCDGGHPGVPEYLFDQPGLIVGTDRATEHFQQFLRGTGFRPACNACPREKHHNQDWLGSRLRHGVDRAVERERSNEFKGVRRSDGQVAWQGCGLCDGIPCGSKLRCLRR